MDRSRHRSTLAGLGFGALGAAAVLGSSACGLLLGTLDVSLAPDAGDGETGEGGVTGEGAATKSCDGRDVKLDDPRFGCAASSCAPCSIAHGTASCVGGACAIGTCDRDQADCDGDASNGCESDVSSDHDHCGACTRACGAQVCDQGACAASCGGPRTSCGGSCVDLTSSAGHCGACGKACPGVANGVPSCANGACGVACNDGFHLCGGRCVPQSPSACGEACDVCAASAPSEIATCTRGECGKACAQGYTACGDSCVDFGDPASCGSCTHACPVFEHATATCSNGNCGIVCNSGFGPCGGGCAPPEVSCVTGTKRVFVTSVQYGSDLGGLAGADAKCASLAGGLNGTFKAWLSDSKTTAYARLTHSTGPYVLVDGTTVVAADFQALLGYQDLPHAPDHTELGTLVPCDVSSTSPPFAACGVSSGCPGTPAAAWTGTLIQHGDVFAGGTCGDWANPAAVESTAGNARSTSSWTTACSQVGSPCSSYTARLLCFEQ